MSEKIFIFESILKEIMESFIQEKKAVGYKFQKGASILKRFDTLIAQEGLKEKKLPKELVMLWTEKTPNETNQNRSHRISIARGFAKYMVRIGYEAYIYPTATIAVDRYSYCPHIFSESELNSIFSICDQYPKSKFSPYRHLILPLLFRLLYGCGLRISEALNLTYNDIDLKHGNLYIRNAKFGKERIIPMSLNLTERCRKYHQELCTSRTINNFLFPSPYGGHYESNTIYNLFRGMLWKSGISHTGKGPRVHDLRHTFAVHCLKRWVLNGNDLTNLLPYLSTYLGHVDLRGTQHYLRLTADLYPNIVTKVEQKFSYLIPEVTSYEAN